MFEALGMTLGIVAPLIDGAIPPHRAIDGGWALESGEQVLFAISDGAMTRIAVRAEGFARPLTSLGLRFRVSGVRRFLRNGWHSWDGSEFLDCGASVEGHAMTALLPDSLDAALVLGFERHDRFQTHFRFDGDTIDVEALLDATGATEGETLLLFSGPGVEDQLRRWSRAVAAASPLPPRIPDRRITGWCSWYNLYAAIDETVILEHLESARRFRDEECVPLDIFLIDDGFTPEMGDWLDVKPHFSRGMKPLLAEIAAAGFTPGLWIAPFLVGNRSKLYRDHPDWVVGDRDGGPLVAMRFYGEFRWHKRSEEYYTLDVTHPDARAHIADVFRVWARDWGVRYFKTDFMHHGMAHGPARAVWHRSGRSRVAVWRQMAALIREAIGEDAQWLGCGCPLWASVGHVDAMRIGRDIGVKWAGEQSAESLLRDQLTRNHAANILWQADPDCILLRGRYHELSDREVTALARFAAGSGGLLMTSDLLDALPLDRRALFASLLRDPVTGCDYPELGQVGPPIAQLVHHADGKITQGLFNIADNEFRHDDLVIQPHDYHIFNNKA